MFAFGEVNKCCFSRVDGSVGQDLIPLVFSDVGNIFATRGEDEVGVQQELIEVLASGRECNNPSTYRQTTSPDGEKGVDILGLNLRLPPAVFHGKRERKDHLRFFDV